MKNSFKSKHNKPTKEQNNNTVFELGESYEKK